MLARHAGADTIGSEGDAVVPALDRDAYTRTFTKREVAVRATPTDSNSLSVLALTIEHHRLADDPLGQ